MRSLKDPTHIFKDVYDPEKQAIRASLLGGMSFSLDSEEDSVSTVRNLTVEANTEADATKVRAVCLFAFSGKIEIAISPVDTGDKWISIARGEVVEKPVLEVFPVIARRIKLNADGEAYLVVQE